MHDCEIEKNGMKKLKTHFECVNTKEQRIQDKPRSAFRFFMGTGVFAIVARIATLAAIVVS
ncbi:hypothetical protein CASFOL_024342 [Castilleja foliolosa]|uniref:Uncharacterized protein n=1 Tax=Castilleja foliolosa TaxID=1961234 RepID=A0ABD3CN02_9LAMI